jgi:uncharacterized protein (TIGR02996 family)
MLHRLTMLAKLPAWATVDGLVRVDTISVTICRGQGTGRGENAMTFQVRERLVYRGRVTDIACLPLSLYRGPARVPRIVSVPDHCWRGYVGTWELRDDALFLTGLAIPPDIAGRDALPEMFPESLGHVAATWFSGEITPEFWREKGPLFALVFHNGRLLLEETLDAEGAVTANRLTTYSAGLFGETERGFLQAIWADRADPTPRLVYADWLEERGDTRATALRDEAQRVRVEGPARRSVKPYSHDDLPGGTVDAGDRAWFWRRLADVRGKGR